MSLVDGPSLHTLVQEHGRLSTHRTAQLGADVLAALRSAHQAGVLHRDVKPQNVLVDPDGRAVLTDFGIAAVAGASQGLTGTGAVIGTMEYVAPERMSGQPAEAPSDLWSLGATLYFAVEGKDAFSADNPAALIAAILSQDPPPPEHAGSLESTILGLLTRDPADRFSAEEAGERLREVAHPSGPDQRTITDQPPTDDSTIDQLSLHQPATDQPTERSEPQSLTTPDITPTDPEPETAGEPPRRRRAQRAGYALLTVAVMSAILLAAVALRPDSGTSRGNESPHPSADPDGSTKKAQTDQSSDQKNKPDDEQSRKSATDPPSEEFAEAPNLCLFLVDHEQQIAPLVPQASYDGKDSADGCSWEDNGPNNRESIDLNVNAYLVHSETAIFSHCKDLDNGEKLSGFDKAYIDEQLVDDYVGSGVT